MNKKLFGSAEEHRQQRELIGDFPSFDLGLEDSPREDHAAAVTDGLALMSEEHVSHVAMRTVETLWTKYMPQSRCLPGHKPVRRTKKYRK